MFQALGQEIHMSLEHLVVPEIKDVLITNTLMRAHESKETISATK